MTAEVAILNSNAVALVADSAVTVGSGGGKVYASADKLFQISNNAPVGIVFYGQAHFLGVPWETVVKCYRSELGNRLFPRLSDYLDDFIRYVRKSKQMFPLDHQRRDIRANIAGFFHSVIREKFEDVANHKCDEDAKAEVTESQFKRLFAESVKKELEETKKYPKLQNISARVIDAIKKQYEREVAPIRKKVFGEMPMFKSTQRHVKEIFVSV